MKEKLVGNKSLIIGGIVALVLVLCVAVYGVCFMSSSDSDKKDSTTSVAEKTDDSVAKKEETTKKNSSETSKETTKNSETTTTSKQSTIGTSGSTDNRSSIVSNGTSANNNATKNTSSNTGNKDKVLSTANNTKSSSNVVEAANNAVYESNSNVGNNLNNVVAKPQEPEVPAATEALTQAPIQETTKAPKLPQVTTEQTTKPQEETTEPQEETTKPQPETPFEDTNQGDVEVLYNQLFDLNNKVTIKMDISDSEIRKLQQDYVKYDADDSKSPIYRKIDKLTITINDTSYVLYEVGVRLKGNTSRTDLYNGNDVNDRNLVHFKLSFKQTFDNKDYYESDAKVWDDTDARKARKKRTFAGLEGLELKWNRNLDSTYLTNVYSNMMFRDMGVLAQNTTVGNVHFGGMNYGVYTIYEPVDENFIKRNISKSDQDGDLYKCAWAPTIYGWRGASYKLETLASIGKEDEDEGLFYVYDLKTNKNKSDNSFLKNLINTINKTPTKVDYTGVVDTDYWAKFAATSYFAGNPDDMRNNYNNHYVYFLKSGKAIFIPYDYDRSFGITLGMNKGMETENPYSNSAKGFGSKQENPLYTNSVTESGNHYCISEYKEQLEKIANSKWMKYDTFKKYADIVKEHYKNVAIPDSKITVNAEDHIKDRSALGFSESNTYNLSVSAYMSSILNSYNKNKDNYK